MRNKSVGKRGLDSSAVHKNLLYFIKSMEGRESVLGLNKIVCTGSHIKRMLYLLPMTAHALYVIINNEQKRGEELKHSYIPSQ